jgi:hypothetical protein
VVPPSRCLSNLLSPLTDRARPGLESSGATYPMGGMRVRCQFEKNAGHLKHNGSTLEWSGLPECL